MKNKTLFLTLLATTALNFPNAYATCANDQTCGTNCCWDLTDGVLTISTDDKTTSGSMDNYYDFGAPWLGGNITSVVIEGKQKDVDGNQIAGTGITNIGNEAFYGKLNIQSVTIPDSVTSIGGSAFDSCFNLTSVTLPDSLTSIGNSAFSSTGLTSITIPDSVTSIGGSAFYGAGDLQSVNFGENSQLTNIGSEAFFDTKLQSITIPNSVTSIGFDAFAGASNLTDITIPDYLSVSEFCEDCGWDEVNGKADLIERYNNGQVGQAFYDLAMAYYAENDENDWFGESYGTYLSIFGWLDLSKVTIHCSGDINKCKANMAVAGHEEGTYTMVQAPKKNTNKEVKNADGSYTIYDKDGNFLGFKGKRIYTIDEANQVAGKTNSVKIRYR